MKNFEIKKYLLNIKDLYLKKRYFDYLLVAFAVILAIYLNWALEYIILYAFLIWVIVSPVSSKLLAKLTLGSLLFVPFILLINRTSQANNFTIYTFYFLVLTVTVSIIEYISDKKNRLAGKSK